MKTIAQVVLLALLLVGAAQADVAVPPLKHRVTDLTSTLDAKQTEWLESRLAAFEAKKGAQLAVLIVPTTQPETIEQFSMRVVEKWKLGRKKVDDGVLLLVAKDDRKLRIEVGYGLEGVLPDATAKRIIAETITPFFKDGRFYAGINAGTTAVMQVISGEHLPPPRQVEAPPPRQVATHPPRQVATPPPPQIEASNGIWGTLLTVILVLAWLYHLVVDRKRIFHYDGIGDVGGLIGGIAIGGFTGGGGSFGGGGASGSW